MHHAEILPGFAPVICFFRHFSQWKAAYVELPFCGFFFPLFCRFHFLPDSRLVIVSSTHFCLRL